MPPALALGARGPHTTENPKISDEVLFTRKGCEVGRFLDYGRPVYVTICPDLGLSAAQSSYVESCGKSCWHTVERHQKQGRGVAAAPSALSAPRARAGAGRAPRARSGRRP